MPFVESDGIRGLALAQYHLFRLILLDVNLPSMNGLEVCRQLGVSGIKSFISATEYSLLEYLMRNAGQTLTRKEILDHVWQFDFGGKDNILDCYIGYLRIKIDKGREPLIHTGRGVVYRIREA